MESKELKEHLAYLRDPETIKQKRLNMLNQVVEYLNHKHKDSNIQLNEKDSTFLLSGNNVEGIIEDLKDIGLYEN